MKKIINFLISISILILVLSPRIYLYALDEFSFLVLADTHGDAASVLDDASARYGRTITFVTGTGDNSPVTNYMGWDGLDEKVHRAFGPGFPWFSSLGNHNIDSPTDMNYILGVIMPRFPTQLTGLSNLNVNGLPHTDISIKAFGVFRRNSGDDKRNQALNKLINAGLGHTDIPVTNPIDANYFIWTNPEMPLAEFAQALSAIDFSDCLLAYTITTQDLVRTYLQMIYMVNKVSPYSFDYKNAHFIFLNLYYDDMLGPGHICPRQMEWLRNDLESNTKPIVFAFGHEPAWPWGNRHLGDSLDQVPAERDEFFELMRQHNGIAYFSGHTHVYGRSLHNGVYDIGAGGAQGSENGGYTYVVVHVKDNKITFEALSRNYPRGETTYALMDNWTVDASDPVNSRWQNITPGPGGWVTALAIDPNNSNRVLAGGDVFGAAVSNDGGLTWEPSFGFKMNEIESFFMPLATYGGSSFYEFAATIGGVYETYDAGNDWMEKTAEGKWYEPYNPIDNWPKPSTDIISRPISSIAMASRVYAASGSMRRPNIDNSRFGLIYRFSFNSDTQSWNFVSDLKTVTGGEANIQHLIAQFVDYSYTGVPDRLFVSLRNNGVWRSNDGGATWINTNLPVPTAYTMAGYSYNFYYRYRQWADVLYVATGDTGVYKTVDAGNTWTHLPVDVCAEAIGTTDANTNVVYVGSYSGPNRGVMKSIDGGATWQKVFDGYNLPTLPYPQGSTGIRYHALAVDPKNANHVVVGDDVNLYVTFDGGATWQSAAGSTSDGGKTWTSSNFNGLCAEFIAFDPRNPEHYLLGAADGALWQSWDKGKTFSRDVTDDLQPGVDPGEVFSDFQEAQISAQDSNTIYLISDVVGNDEDNWGPLFKTTDAGRSWLILNPGPFVSFKLKKDNAQIIVAIAGLDEKGVIKRSGDAGRTFNSVSARIDAVKISTDPLNPNIFYATSPNGVYKSSDAGASWINIGGPGAWSRFSEVAVDPNNTSILYSTSYDGFWKYDGTGWSRIKSVELASDITVTRNGIIYGATMSFPSHDKDLITTGIWRSDDGGNNWYLDVEGIHTKRMAIIEANPIDGTVIAGADGGGFYLYDFVPQISIIYGDVSGDSEISAYDAALTAQAAVGLITLTAEQTQKADVSGDAEISAYDAALIAQKAVGLIDKFPVEG